MARGHAYEVAECRQFTYRRIVTSRALYRTDPSGFVLVLKTHFDLIGLMCGLLSRSAVKVPFRRMDVHSSRIVACRHTRYGLFIAFSYVDGSPSVAIDVSACITIFASAVLT